MNTSLMFYQPLITRTRSGFLSVQSAFRSNLRLQEQQQVITPTRLRIGSRHVESAERMHANERAGTLAIQIQVPHMKLSARAIELRLVVTVNSARQAKLRIVRDLQSIVI